MMLFDVVLHVELLAKSYTRVARYHPAIQKIASGNQRVLGLPNIAILFTGLAMLSLYNYICSETWVVILNDNRRSP